MTSWINELLAGLSNPAILFGHFTYLLLIVSMLMRRMVLLRSLAVASGVAKIIYRAFFVFDPVSVLWEAIFVIVNVVQLFLIWYYEYQHSFAEDEKHFAESMPGGVDRSAVKRLLDHAELVQFEPGATLTTEGEPVQKLMYLADGIVKIERGDRIVAICGPGDYVGELSFLSGSPASASATVVKPTRILSFDQKKLTAAIEADAQLRRTLESALNRNLAGKLVRANDAGELPSVA
ncbi:Crp/Fnr family transcriptional regulator [Devosia sp.]|uniref:Crp/Fnr family transcriptional regulator n=1 Tax=Devosia sp. TaxID=1871048 RepID=UPI003BAC24D5